MANQPPKLCRHKHTDRAYVTLNGKRVYLGPWGSEEAQEQYLATLAAWRSNGKRLPQPNREVAVVEVAAEFLRHARQHYVHRDGTPTGQLPRVEVALKRLRETYGHSPAKEFGPQKLKALRDTWIADGLARNTVNGLVAVVKQAFRHAAELELIDGSVVVNLSMLRGLQRGRTPARETEPVRPVDEAHVEAVRPLVSRQVSAMIEFQRLTGARPGEVVNLRRGDIDDGKAVWEVQLREHKTCHRDKARVIFVGPQAQMVLKPFMLRAPDKPLFSPAEAERERIRGKKGKPRREDQKPNPRKTDRTLGEAYTVTSYRRAVQRACRKVNAERDKNGGTPIEVWSPNQLRHTAATRIRKEFGLEAAQAILGHSHADVTQIYAEVNYERARQIAGNIG